MVWLSNFKDKVQQLTGWRCLGAAILSGLLAGLSVAPTYLIPLLFVTYPVLVWLLEEAVVQEKWKRATWALGWGFGFGYFVVGLYWMAVAFFVQADQFALLSPLALFGLPAFLGLFTGGATLLAGALWRRSRRSTYGMVLLFAASWSFVEYLRGHVLTGLPWNLTAQSFAGSSVLMQGLSVVGPYGMGLVLLLISCLPILALRTKGKIDPKPFIWMGAACTVIVVHGMARLALSPTTYRDDAVLQVVQPNVSQKQKINGKWVDNFYAQMAQSGGSVFDDIPQGVNVYVIWPENSVAFLDESVDALDGIAQLFPAEALLLAGVLRRELRPDQSLAYFNSMTIFAEAPGENTGQDKRLPIISYDKSHLVPFGEYLPLANVLQSLGLSQLAPLEEGFQRGSGLQTVPLGNTTVSPLICYEIIFPNKSYDKNNRPDWLLTVTNDAWYGDTSGPRQHYDMARMRAVETGLPVVRSANTGISGIIDSNGRSLQRLPLNNAGALVGALPGALPVTLYMHLGDWPYFIMLLLLIGGAFRRGYSMP